MGVPFVGADICGFLGKSNGELCARWVEAGAFYPFARDHSAFEPQELYLWPETRLASRTAMRLRYRLLPYLYTQFYLAHTKGGTVVRPLFFEFPTERDIADIDTQWMLGSAILVAPVLEQKMYSRTVYLPKGTWY